MAKKRKAPIEAWEARLGSSAFDPLAVMDLQDAIRNKRKKVTLNGREFRLKYSDDSLVVFYAPVEGFAPAGYLNIEKFLED